LRWLSEMVDTVSDSMSSVSIETRDPHDPSESIKGCGWYNVSLTFEA